MASVLQCIVILAIDKHCLYIPYLMGSVSGCGRWQLGGKIVDSEILGGKIMLKAEFGWL